MVVRVILIAVLWICSQNAVFASDTDKFMRKVTLNRVDTATGAIEADSLRNDISLMVYTYDRELIVTTSREVELRVRVYDARIGDVYYDRTVTIFPAHVCEFYDIDEQFMLDVTVGGITYTGEFYFCN